MERATAKMKSIGRIPGELIPFYDVALVRPLGRFEMAKTVVAAVPVSRWRRAVQSNEIRGTNGKPEWSLTIQKKSRIRQRIAQPPSSSPANTAFNAEAK